MVSMLFWTKRSSLVAWINSVTFHWLLVIFWPLIGQVVSVLHWFTFGCGPLNSRRFRASANAQKVLNQPRDQKIARISRAWPKINLPYRIEKLVHVSNLRSIWWAVCPQMYGNSSTGQRAGMAEIQEHNRKLTKTGESLFMMSNPTKFAFNPIRCLSATAWKLGAVTHE